MYLCVIDIDFSSFFDCSTGAWNCCIFIHYIAEFSISTLLIVVNTIFEFNNV